MEKPYPYQERVHQLLMAGKNVIIQAPTGSGKTRAALLPFFHVLDRYDDKSSESSPLPVTCRYAVPMRVLATQFEREYHDWFKRLDKARGTRFTECYGKLEIKIPAIQTGETPDDPEFESPLTFCTIDQLLASFIGTPYSISPRLANVNVGAIAGSYLILDEFHLYPLERTSQGARTTTLAMLQLLAGLSPFVMMTATFSTELLGALAGLLDAEVVRVMDEAELREIMRDRERTIHLEADCMTPEAILAAHDTARERGAGASLVVCNTVARAQEAYVRLRDELQRRGQRVDFNLQLIHSRFTSADRKEKSEKLEEWLGKDRWRDGRFSPIDGKDVIVVGTQVVEVGLNISAGVLHTEIAPANSLIQRAGRCARFDKQIGEVIVYPIPPRETEEQNRSEEAKVSYLPYNRQICEKTWEEIGALVAANGGQPIAFDFPCEQGLIDAVHTLEDQVILASFDKNAVQIKREIMEVLDTHERGREGELIRNVEQVSVIIHAAPQDAITAKPFTWQSFGLNPGTLAGAWPKLDERSREFGIDWTMKELKPVGEAGSDALGADGDNDCQPPYTWEKMSLSEKNAYSLIRSALRVALPPQLAAYDQELGFRLLVDVAAPVGTWQSSPGDQKKRAFEPISGKQGSYVEHISGLMRAYRHSVRNELAWIAQKLERALDLPAGKIDQAVRLAIACHDIGKLSQGWQRWARAWQKLLVREYGAGYEVRPGREWLAKTDRLDWRSEKELRKKIKNTRPHHACEGTIASAMLIATRLAKDLSDAQRATGGLSLTQATVNAIARHHAPLAESYESVSWDDSARTAIIAALQACGLSPDEVEHVDLHPRAKGEIRQDYLISPTALSAAGVLTTWLGFTLVRALRLCDQRAEREL